MKTCTRKLDSHPQKSSSPTRQNGWAPASSCAVHPLRDLQQTVGNQAVLRLVQAKSRLQSPKFFDDQPKGGNKKPETAKPPSREPCDNKCGTGASYGNTECAFDLKSGLLTGKVTKEVFDKNACTRPCVEVHENVHAKKIEPICVASKKCLDAAGENITKQNKCLDQHEADMNAVTFSTECAAYTAEQECLSKRAKTNECKSADGKKRFDEQLKMVNCYQGCFCKG